MEADHVDLRVKFGCGSVDKAITLQSIKGSFCKNCSPNKPKFFTPQYIVVQQKNLLDV